MSPRQSHPSYGAVARHERPRVVVALGGTVLANAFSAAAPGRAPEGIELIASSLASLARDRDLVVTFGIGNGLGRDGLSSFDDPEVIAAYPLDAIEAEMQGLLGYWLCQALHNHLLDREVASVLTRTVVSRRDAAFDSPSSFVGPAYAEEEAHRLAARHGWVVRRDGLGWRRLVPAPTPQGVMELPAIRTLVEHGTIVVCGGGGGIPVARLPDGRFEGVDALVDKDLTSATIAEGVRADSLLLITDVPAVSTDIADPSAAIIGRTTPSDLDRRRWAAGSMAPKVAAACRFVERTGATATIGRLDDLPALLAGEAGTVVIPDGVSSN